jgi:hypothetical protein
MILNLSKIKTEALLLFCKDLINSYKDKEDLKSYGVDKEIITNFNNIGNDMLKEILKVTYEDNFYLSNRKHYKIKAILDAYNFINQEISKLLKQGDAFNPSMLYFSMLAVWFKELNKESRSKEYIYFLLYPYGHVYDKLLDEIKNEDFKKLNIKMIELAEKIVYRLDAYSFR